MGVPALLALRRQFLPHVDAVSGRLSLSLLPHRARQLGASFLFGVRAFFC
jgi:hypothetical protein